MQDLVHVNLDLADVLVGALALAIVVVECAVLAGKLAHAIVLGPAIDLQKKKKTETYVSKVLIARVLAVTNLIELDAKRLRILERIAIARKLEAVGCDQRNT